MTTAAYITEAAAVARSISHDETAFVALPEDISGRDEREAAVLEQLEGLGLEDYSRENDGSLDCWGTHEGNEWRVRTVDGLTQSVRYLR